ncbi:MAG: hypothetical protein Crog4KO_25610 [Crocinitomicaceae bacterium]
MLRMKQLLFGSILLVNCVGFGQETFHLRSSIGEQLVAFNGGEYQVDSIGIELETHYPGFDTIQFQIDERDRNFVLCNFKPDSSYSLIVACCGSIDLTPSSRLENDSLSLWDYETDFDKIQGVLMDYPTFSFQLTETISDTVWGWVSDAACFPKIYPMTTEALEYGSPNKCFFWSNINHLHFFTQETPLNFWVNDDGLQEPQSSVLKEYDLPDFETFVTVGSVAVRFFDDHHFLVMVNPRTKEVYIRYDD